MAPKLKPQERSELIRKVIEDGEKVTKVCREAGISRVLFYRWLKRYEEAPKDQKLEALWDKKPKVAKYWRQTPEKYEKVVLNLIIEHPELSTHKIVHFLPQIGGRPLLSNHGVQNVLRRHHLTSYDRRLAYSSQALRHPVVIDRFVHGFQNLFGRLYALPTRGRTFAVRFVLTFSLGVFLGMTILGVRGLWQTLQAVTLSTRLGLVFVLISLGAGSLFFLYSLRYYFILTLVLGFSRQVSGSSVNNTSEVEGLPAKAGGDTSEVGRNGRGILERIFGVSLRGASKHLPGVPPISHHLEGEDRENGGGYGQRGITGGLQPDLSQVKLERQPFVSIHLPLYNEKRVVERLLTACTSIEYPNYEVVVVDDSTDETTEIVQEFTQRWNQSLSHHLPGGGAPASDAGIHLEGEKNPRPWIKVIHRTSREGFKGGALKVALEATDPRAEFILVFDADFLPYPDTITQFLKYFQVTAGSLDISRWSLANGRKEVASDPALPAGRQRLKTNDCRVAAVQGYQWHVLNKSENWITRGVRSEYAGSYVVERPGGEILSAIKQIAGSVFMIRKDILDHYGWGSSITEDFQLTLKLYRDGYKVVYTPYIQTPSECVSRLGRLIRQRMRWAEGHSHNIKRMFSQLMFGRWETVKGENLTGKNQELRIMNQGEEKEENLNSLFLIHNSSRDTSKSGKVWVPSKLTLMEKLEFLYLSPYYLQATFFMLGTLSWFISEAVFQVKLPFWTSLWGWSLVFTNLCALPLMNTVGLFLEESEERDYMGILSFVSLSYLLAPFQGYAAVKGFLERNEGPWFRTPKTGRITDIFTPGRFTRFISGFFGRSSPFGQTWGYGAVGRPAVVPNLVFATANTSAALSTFGTSTRISAFSNFQNFRIKRKNIRWVGKVTLGILLAFSVTLFSLTRGVPEVLATNPSGTFNIHTDLSTVLTTTVSHQLQDAAADVACDTGQSAKHGKNAQWRQWKPDVSNNTADPGTPCPASATGTGWIFDSQFGPTGYIDSGAWNFYLYTSDNASANTGNIRACVYRAQVSGTTLGTSTLFFQTTGTADVWVGGALESQVTTGATPCSGTNNRCEFTSTETYLYVDFYANSDNGANSATAAISFGEEQCGTSPYVRIVTPIVSIPEKVAFLVAAAPFIPMMVLWMKKRKKALALMNN